MLAGIWICGASAAQEFNPRIDVPAGPMKDQQSSGTCWSFAVTSFLESEALRLGHDFVALSLMLYVHPAYLGKAQRYLETQGESYFEAGDLSFSVLDGYRSLGAVPESVYSGMPERFQFWCTAMFFRRSCVQLYPQLVLENLT
ncbi:MAG: hypothetical protein AB8B96_18480 [Lysobacterales bacterium]